MTIPVKISSRAYKVVVRVLAREPEDTGVREFYEALFGRGPGDPDFHAPPWEYEDIT